MKSVGLSPSRALASWNFSADGGEEAVDFLLGQTDAIVGEEDQEQGLAGPMMDLDRHLALETGARGGCVRTDGVDAVLQQLAPKDLPVRCTDDWTADRSARAG